MNFSRSLQKHDASTMLRNVLIKQYLNLRSTERLKKRFTNKFKLDYIQFVVHEHRELRIGCRRDRWLERQFIDGILGWREWQRVIDIKIYEQGMLIWCQRVLRRIDQSPHLSTCVDRLIRFFCCVQEKSKMISMMNFFRQMDERFNYKTIFITNF